ncbi:MAG TPA: hypothetical protein VKZ91_11030 [Woeseiaceae bacterium]|nr:hypothetical protein [Woeseiaceae bacterium]
MKVLHLRNAVLLAVLALAACQDASDPGTGGNDSSSSTPSAPATAEVGSNQAVENAGPGTADEGASSSADVPASSGGKPSAPISIDYTVIGTPVVGQPVNINLEVSSSLGNRPVTLNYRINDARNLSFPQAQAQRVALSAPAGAGRAAQQVTVVPQREGRLYLNVSAEVETDEGMMMKSMAIPIQVGRAPEQQETNGELREGADGETVISMPAEESTP